MVAERPGEISALTKFKSEFGLKKLEISGLKNSNLKKKSNLPPHPQKAWLNPCLASSREIAGQTEKGEFVYFTKMYFKTQKNCGSKLVIGQIMTIKVKLFSFQSRKFTAEWKVKVRVDAENCKLCYLNLCPSIGCFAMHCNEV